MNVNQIIQKFLENPSRMDMGAGKLSKAWRCKRDDIYEARKVARNIIKQSDVTARAGKLPKILVMDIETAPLKAYVWNIWNQNVTDDQMISSYSWLILCWSAKWLFDSHVYSDSLTSSEVLAENDKRVLKSLWGLLNEADIVIAHNGERFDIPKINARLVYHNLEPTAPYQQIDTLKVIRKEFGFVSNRLDSVAKLFGMGGKIKTSFDLWKRCVEGDESAIAEMVRYNKKDVELLEDVYLKIRPWIKGHPNLGLYMEADESVCPNCGSSHISVNGSYYTSSGRYTTFKCNDCGAFSRMRHTNYPKDKRKQLLVSVGR